MEFSLSPCCRGLLCRTISNSHDSKKARKWNTLGHAAIDLGENGSVIPRRGPEVVPPEAASFFTPRVRKGRSPGTGGTQTLAGFSPVPSGEPVMAGYPSRPYLGAPRHKTTLDSRLLRPGLDMFLFCSMLCLSLWGGLSIFHIPSSFGTTRTRTWRS